MTASPELSSDIYGELDHIVDTQDVSYHDGWVALSEKYGIEVPTYDPSDAYATTNNPAVAEQDPDSAEEPLYGPFGQTATRILDDITAAQYRSELSHRGGEIVKRQSRGDISAHESRAIFDAMRRRTAELTATRIEEPPEEQ